MTYADRRKEDVSGRMHRVWNDQMPPFECLTLAQKVSFGRQPLCPLCAIAARLLSCKPCPLGGSLSPLASSVLPLAEL